MIQLTPRDDGFVLPVKARAGARQNELRGEQQGALKVAVTQVAEKGKANRAIANLLAKELGLRKAQIELIGGATSPQKEFLIRDVEREELEQRILEIIGGDANQRD